MNKTDLSIVTMTWARNYKEEKLLRESLTQLAQLQLPVYITDGGSGSGFLDFLRSFSNFILTETRATGVWPQVQNSLKAAYKAGSPFILYSEPDKRGFFKQGLTEMIRQVAVDEQSGIIVAARSKPGFASYPAFQRMTETTINNCCSEITGISIDYTYGPFIMNRLLVPYPSELRENIGWGWRPYVFVVAKQQGYTLEAHEGDYFCLPEQQEEDSSADRFYRIKQLSQNIEALVLAGARESIK